MASRKQRRFNFGESSEERLDLSPMIDMVFLLLIFFLVNANMIVVQQDVKVEVPIATDAKKPDTKNGRIVVNIYRKGSFKDASGKRVLFSSSEITDYIRAEKEKMDLLGYEPVLHLRGDRKAVFKHCRSVIQAAAQAGVDRCVFASFVNPHQYR